jgi:RNA polymerase sigma-70 factor, ECF subfamily
MGADDAMLADEELDRCYRRLFRTALRLTGNDQDAADLTQQALCDGMAKWQLFRGQSDRLTWLHRILTNGFRDWARRKAVRWSEPLDEWALRPVGNGDASAADRLGDQEQLERLRKTIAGLSPPLRAAFVVTVMDGYSHREAAGILDVPVGTVASRVRAARQQISAEMHKAFPET